ncbi:MAG: endopeptidase La [Bacteroidales bacterium]|nr:endopeptidase La [Candidatus Colimorpha onthohippi]
MKFSENDDSMFENILDHAEFIPIINKADEDFLLTLDEIPDEVPLVPIRDNVLFPGAVLPVSASRKRSIRAFKTAKTLHRGQLSPNSVIAIVTQVNDAEVPTQSDLYSIGVLARVLKTFELPNNSLMAIVQGCLRIRINTITETDPYYKITFTTCPELGGFESREEKSLIRKIRKSVTELFDGQRRKKETITGLKNIGSDRIFINYIATSLNLSTAEKQLLLECDDYMTRARKFASFIEREREFQDINEEIQNRTKFELDKQQREYFLNQQMRVIQNELGGGGQEQEIETLQEKASHKKWSEATQQIFDKELNKLRRMPQQSPDYNVQINYLETILDLPWQEYSTDNYSLSRARNILDADHYGIEKVKQRIIEYLAVLSLKQDMKSPIICLVGPPGTGKTSLGRSIADALQRKYVRVALGGLHDESEIRGHRRTYIGAMPGRIIQSMKKAKTSNPVFILDEIDKIQNNSIQGDPTSALLEVLDPEQNIAFHDNYLDIDYDLSKVLFIATANSLNTIQPALLDRMEIIDLNGYLLEEKIEIAKRHLLPRQITEHGLRKGSVTIDDETLTHIINDYTRESGVRQLDKTIAKIVRNKAVMIASQASAETPKRRLARAVKTTDLKEILGLPIHNSERCGSEPLVGVVTGLAWTSVGGEILFVESSCSKGKGTLSMTGNLGDVMKESATLAFEYIKANATQLGVDYKLLDESNIHIHVPEGATPKDGPSAGITMFISMLSTLTKRKVRNNFAMTGEITLRGNVTPVGGIKEKILAAKRAGITDIILCEANQRDIEDIESQYINGLNFHYINTMSQAVPLAII